jgi:pimeloyl-ACP methyl ester carboxylesterase
MTADRNRTPNSGSARLRRYAGGALAAGAIVHLLMRYERRLLARLDNRPDEDDRALSFPHERTYEVEMRDGASIHVAECGAGRPVVLLHGHGASLEIFALLAARLAAAGQRVIAIDHRGFGQSSEMPPTFGFDGLVDDVGTVLERLDLRETVIVGHSMGGAVALGLAVDRPEIVDERVAALVVVNSTARGPADRPLVRAKATVLDWSVTERVARHPRVGVLVSSMNFGADARHSHVVAARAAGAMSPASRRPGFTRRLLGIDLSEGLANVRVPVLALAGSVDRVLPVSESEWIVGRVPNGRLEVLAGAGHVLPVERSGPVAEIIVRFADDLDRSG